MYLTNHLGKNYHQMHERKLQTITFHLKNYIQMKTRSEYVICAYFLLWLICKTFTGLSHEMELYRSLENEFP